MPEPLGLIAGLGDFGNVVGRLLWGNGVGCTVLDNDSDRVEILRKLGLSSRVQAAVYASTNGLA